MVVAGPSAAPAAKACERAEKGFRIRFPGDDPFIFKRVEKDLPKGAEAFRRKRALVCEQFLALLDARRDRFADAQILFRLEKNIEIADVLRFNASVFRWRGD